MSTDLTEMAGRAYGPFHLRTSVGKVEEFVEATGDSDRWERYAPPGFAAVLLFKTAPEFFSDPDVEPFAKTLVHVDQTFRWSAPLPHETDVQVTGTVDSVRHRGEMFFVTFTTTTANEDGTRYMEAASTFLMTEGSLPREKVTVEDEPSWEERAENETPDLISVPGIGQELPPLLKSASRADLVKYAGATRDWNPIHWDHAAAVEAGLPGIITHGLLMASWTAQAAGRVVDGPRPLRDMRLRFRQPLRPAVQAEVHGVVKSEGSISLAIRAGDDDVEVVTADATFGESDE